MASGCTHGRGARRAATLLALAGLTLAAGCPGGPKLYDRHLSRYYLSKIPQAVRVADLDGNGKPDILTANDAGDAISIHWNTGDGHLAPEVALQLVTTEHVLDAQVADVTGDGKPDIVTLLSKGVAILANQGGGQFAVPATGGRVAPCTGCSALVVGDFTGDGHPDLYVVGGTNSDLWPGPGFAVRQDPPPPHLLVPPVPVVAHLDAGKTDDLLGMRQGANGPELVALLGQPAGTFLDQAAPAPPSGKVITALVAADLNGDGLDDAVVAGKGFIGVYLRTATGFDPLRLHPVDALVPEGLAVADVDGDGQPDILVGNQSGLLRTFVSAGALSYVEAPTQTVGPQPVGIAGADLDADGFADVAVVTKGTCCPPAYAGLQVLFGGPFTGSAGAFTLTAP